MIKRILTCLTLTAIVAVGAKAVKPRLVSETDMKACNHWVDSVYNSMTERQRVAQLVFPKVVPTQGATSKATIKRLVENGQVGGLIFTEGRSSNTPR